MKIIKKYDYCFVYDNCFLLEKNEWKLCNWYVFKSQIIEQQITNENLSEVKYKTMKPMKTSRNYIAYLKEFSSLITI